MTTRNVIRLVMRLIVLCSVAALSGCYGANNSSTVPFAELISLDGVGTSAQFNAPLSITKDNENLYVADSNNHTIRKIVIATGVVTTLAGRAGVSGSTDGIGSEALFRFPYGIKTDGIRLYVADTGNRTIRMIALDTGRVTTLAGTAGLPGTSDGTGTGALFSSPFGIAVNGANLYVTDTVSDTIRKIVIATGEVTTLAGSAGTKGATDGTGTTALFNFPQGITTDGTNLYVSDTNNNSIRKIVLETGEVTTLAGGDANTSGSADGTGTAARFKAPSGITTDRTNLYVADTGNHTIRRVEIATGVVTTLAGSAGVYGTTDGIGQAARFYSPSGIAAATDGTLLYVADTNNNTIRTITTADNTVSTLAGSGP